MARTTGGQLLGLAAVRRQTRLLLQPGRENVRHRSGRFVRSARRESARRLGNGFPRGDRLGAAIADRQPSISGASALIGNQLPSAAPSGGAVIVSDCPTSGASFSILDASLMTFGARQPKSTTCSLPPHRYSSMV